MDSGEIIPEFGIERENEQPVTGCCAFVYDPATQKYAVGQLDDKDLLILFSGGVKADENIKDGIIREVAEESGLHDFLLVEEISQAKAHYYNILKAINRVALVTCFLIVLKTINRNELSLEAHEKFHLVWKTRDEIVSNWESQNEGKDYDHWIFFSKKAADKLKELGY